MGSSFKIALFILLAFACAASASDFSDLMRRADISAGNKDFKEAYKLYARAVEISPESARAHNGLGYANYELGLHETAEAEYTKALELDPDFAVAYNNLGIIHYHRQEYESAAEHYKKAIELRPNYAKAMVNLAAAYIKMGNYLGGYMEYLRALRTDDSYVEERKKSEKAKREIGELQDKYSNGEIE